jgi:hypothetical protein
MNQVEDRISESLTRRVVVVFTPQMWTNKETGVVAARYAELGLTGFGSSESVAVSSLKRLLKLFVETHRKRDTLVEVLDRKQVTWEWESEYTGDVERLYSEASPVTAAGLATWVPASRVVVQATREAALAA